MRLIITNPSGVVHTIEHKDIEYVVNAFVVHGIDNHLWDKNTTAYRRAAVYAGWDVIGLFGHEKALKALHGYPRDIHALLGYLACRVVESASVTIVEN